MQKLIFTRLTNFWGKVRNNYSNLLLVSAIIAVFFSLVINKVYDIPGYEVGTLFNEVGKADTQKVEFNAAHLSSGIGYASGVYFYKLQSASFVATKKRSLLR